MRSRYTRRHGRSHLHRDQLSAEWGVAPSELSCILGRTGQERPVVLVSRAQLDACGGSVERLEERLRDALA